MNIQGIIKTIGETKTFGQNGFQKREFVIETNEQYPQPVLLEMIKDKCSVLDKYAEGQEVKVSVNIRGNQWTNPQGEIKTFNSLQVWKIESLGGSQSAPQSKPKPQQADNQEEEDDLPF